MYTRLIRKFKDKEWRMSLLEQVKRDRIIIKTTLSGLDTCTIYRNGVLLTGEDRELTIESARIGNTDELRRLEAILRSNVIPSSYTSIVTEQTYYPSEEELRSARTVRCSQFFKPIITIGAAVSGLVVRGFFGGALVGAAAMYSVPKVVESLEKQCKSSRPSQN